MVRARGNRHGEIKAVVLLSYYHGRGTHKISVGRLSGTKVGLSWPIVPEITHNNGCKMGAKDAKKIGPGPVPTGPARSLENGGHGRTVD